MIDNEKYVDLTKFEELYEEGKKCLANCMPPFDERAQYHSRLYEILQELRDIAALYQKMNEGKEDVLWNEAFEVFSMLGSYHAAKRFTLIRK